jgi:hypothetical protein
MHLASWTNQLMSYENTVRWIVYCLHKAGLIDSIIIHVEEVTTLAQLKKRLERASCVFQEELCICAGALDGVPVSKSI